MCETTELTVADAKSTPERTRFQLYHIPTGESTAVVELDEALLGDPKFIDPERMTFPNIPHGGQYTLIPLEDPTVVILSRVMDVHRRITTTPCQLPSQMMHRMDELVQIVGLMFGEVEAYLVENVEDIGKLTQTNIAEDHKRPPIIKRTILGNLLDEVKAKLAETEGTAGTPETSDKPEEAAEDDDDVQGS